MDRLVQELDRLLADGEVKDEVVITAAAYGERPARARALDIQPYEVLVKLAEFC